MRELRAAGELRNTLVFYLSDNGYFFGEHRVREGKALPYEPSLNVPYAVRVPQRLRTGALPRTSGAVVANVDVAPTILDYAGGAKPCAAGGNCRTLDGRSLRPLLGEPGRFPRHRGVLAELSGHSASHEYAAIRTRRFTYVEYDDGERELYDLRRDPYELRNLAADGSAPRL